VSKNGPSFTRAEVVPESQIPTHTRPQAGQAGLLYVAILVVLLVIVLLYATGH
jgi:hypothetical protein